MNGQKFRKWSIGIAVLLGMFVAGVLTLGGCGGGYSDPNAAITTTKTTALIDAATLKQWVDEGKLNAPIGNRDRVVIVSVTTPAVFTTATRGHIPGAVVLDTSADLVDTRDEGLGPVGSMMLSGARMDSLVQKLGIDGNTTIVLTIPKASSDSETYQMTVAYFTFRYWGFPRERLKILNGGDDAWDFAGRPLTASASGVTPTTYSVRSNKVLKDVVRYSVTEMLSLVDAINKDTTLLSTWQMLDARGYTTAPYMANTLRTKDASGGTAHAMMYLGTRVNGEAARNRLYPDKATFLTRLATLPVINGAADAYLSPDKKTVVMCGSSTSASPTFFLFDAVLAVPEGNIMMFDGSANQWGGYSSTKILAAGASADVAAAWAFDAVTPGTASPRSVGGALAGTNSIAYYTLLPSQLEADQVESADRRYMATGVSSSGSTAGGSSGGGC